MGEDELVEIAIREVSSQIQTQKAKYKQKNLVVYRICTRNTCAKGFINIFMLTFAISETYGPTETSICCLQSSSPSTISRPLSNVLCYVVHPDNGELCPPGVSGELWIGGAGVSLGYHNRPQLTADEKFIGNPFRGSSNTVPSPGKVYKSGDRVKWNDEGELVYLGRFDHQVKVNG